MLAGYEVSPLRACKTHSLLWTHVEFIDSTRDWIHVRSAARSVDKSRSQASLSSGVGHVDIMWADLDAHTRGARLKGIRSAKVVQKRVHERNCIDRIVVLYHRN